METIFLDDMNGFEFQQFIGHLFEKLGFGKVGEIYTVKDAGKDIVIHSYEGGKIIIECKHHPNSTIGRPVVQKLHSAVVTSRAKKGFVVTTGHFSQAAIHYATREIGSLIELIDSKILYDMAKRAGIKLLKKGEKTIVYHIIPPPEELVKKKTLSHLIGNAISHPNTPNQISKVRVRRTHFSPAYLLEYNLNEIFSTTVGVIHSIHIDKGRILINGENGELIKPSIAQIVSPSSMMEEWYPQTQDNISSGKFRLGYTSTKKAGIKQIQKIHTTNVSYTGANNVRYTKKCIPHISKIFIKSLTQIYLPLLEVSCKILSRNHDLTLCGTNHRVEVLDGAAETCEICGKELKDERLLCNSCGRIVHTPRFMDHKFLKEFFIGHSFLCEVCGKTICEECTYWTRKYLFFKKKMCMSCANKLVNDGRKIKKLR